jgi:hypothetical protein
MAKMMRLFLRRCCLAQGRRRLLGQEEAAFVFVICPHMPAPPHRAANATSSDTRA